MAPSRKGRATVTQKYYFFTPLSLSLSLVLSLSLSPPLFLSLHSLSNSQSFNGSTCVSCTCVKLHVQFFSYRCSFLGSISSLYAHKGQMGIVFSQKNSLCLLFQKKKKRQNVTEFFSAYNNDNMSVLYDSG